MIQPAARAQPANRRRHPGARLEVRASAAHLANIEQPTVVGERIAHHLDQWGGAEMSDLEIGMRTRREVLGDEHVDRATGRSCAVRSARFKN